MSDKPKRIQRRRDKGWRLPSNAVCVTRPGKFGNPYPAAIFGLTLALKLFADTAYGIWDPGNIAELPDETASLAYQLHCEWRKRFTRHPVEVIESELRGKDLACWCRLDQECHADVLLEIANREAGR